jgi:CPA2 family monovalent cation:H+ antiporter-2
MGLNLIFDLAVVASVAGLLGLLCRWLQLSVVVGFLLAGMIVGPHTPPFALVKDPERVQMLSELGLLFLIFGIGLGFNIRRIQRLGVSLILTVAIGAILILVACRGAGALLGLSDQQGLFVAAILMVSSSAIIAKVLEEIGANRSTWGQFSLGVTLLEDIAAVVMLTILTAITSQGGDRSIIVLFGNFTGFVVLFSVGVLLLVPRLLRWLDQGSTSELTMLVMAGMLLLLGWFAVSLGYSMALTAFILGAIIGSTPQRPEIDRLFEGLRHLFGAVFFVSMGMIFDIRKLPEFWPAMLGLTAAAVFLRSIAVCAAQLVTGGEIRNSIKAAVTLTPLGEFSFVIALLGVTSGVMPDSFYPAAVGASLLTCLISPLLIRRAEPISEAIASRVPESISNSLASYHLWLERLGSAQANSMMWRILSPRFGQMLLQLLFASGCLALAPPTHRALIRFVGPDFLFPGGTTPTFLLATGVLVLIPLVALWRNIVAVSMIIAEATAARFGPNPRTQLMTERGLTAGAILLTLLWLSALLPTDIVSTQVFLGIIAVLGLLAIILWRHLVRWHARLEGRIHQEYLTASLPSTDGNRQWKMQDCTETEWVTRVGELTLPSDSKVAGKQISDLRLRAASGCSIIAIDRQGFAINSPGATDRLYPGDRLLLLGSEEALAKAIELLSERDDSPAWAMHFEELATESMLVPDGSPLAGKALLTLQLGPRYGVQIGAIRRGERQIPTPAGNEELQPGDTILALGHLHHIRQFHEALLPGGGALEGGT